MATFIEELMGKQEALDTQSDFSKDFILALDTKPSNDASNDKPNPKTKTISKDNSFVEERVGKEELERCYRADSFIFNATNVAVQMIMSAGYTIEAKKLTVRKFFENFVDNISKVGADTTFDEILTRIYQDAYIYGGPWNEIVWNLEDTKPVDLKTLNPKEMDFARDDNGNVALDENEKPSGYTQKLPFGIEATEDMGDPKPEGVALGANQIFILPKRISYIPLYTYGSGFVGIGRVEPAYKATIWKLNLLKAGAESSSRRGFSPIIAKVGNENIHPTPQMINNILENLKKLDYSKYMSMPWYVELTTLDVKSIETYEGFLKYLTAMQSASLGVPVPFVTGLGEETNRATLGTQLEVFEIILNSIAKRVCKSIEKFIFKPIAEAEGFDEVPQLKWNKITTFKQQDKQEKQDKQDEGEKQDEEEKKEDEDDKNKALEFTPSGSMGGQPLDTSHQTQGISYPKGKKTKIKSPKKKKV